jgi:DNA uptake protein ComE-like DNA-binding protein
MTLPIFAYALTYSRATSIATLSMTLLLSSCSPSKEVQASRAAYSAACEGKPLGTIELRNKAMDDGYNIHREYDCIDKASFVAVNEASAKWKAANTPEALAQREAERIKSVAEDQTRRAASAEKEWTNTSATNLPDRIEVRPVDVNTATESELANVISVSPSLAANIVEERKKRRFNDWADLVNRVVGISQAQTAVYASACGLNVNGQSLAGAPPDGLMAAFIKQKYQKN